MTSKHLSQCVCACVRVSVCVWVNICPVILTFIFRLQLFSGPRCAKPAGSTFPQPAAARSSSSDFYFFPFVWLTMEPLGPSASLLLSPFIEVTISKTGLGAFLFLKVSFFFQQDFQPEAVGVGFFFNIYITFLKEVHSDREWRSSWMKGATLRGHWSLKSGANCVQGE